MKKSMVNMGNMVAMATLAAAMAAPAQAGDSKFMMPIAQAMAANDAQSRLGPAVRFYFGKQPTPAVLETLATEKTSQKTNAFRKSNETACNWVFLSAMLQLQKHAEKIGANAVVNIVSNYGNVELSSDTDFECHVGTMMAGVALKGDFVKVAEK